ncbi:MAG: DEAD/DEAH box helicase [Pseudobdellovibrio sp.]
MNNLQNQSDVAALKKPYYHWLERAQLGLIDFVLIQWPRSFYEQAMTSILENFPKTREKLTPIPIYKTYESFDTRSPSMISDLIRGKSYQYNKSQYSELAECVSVYLKNETKITLDQIGQYDLGFNLPRELNPTIIEKQFDFKTAKEKTRLKNFMKFLGRFEGLQSEWMFGFVILELIDNLFVLKSKFPELKIYLNIPFELESYGFEITELMVDSPSKGEYSIVPLQENFNEQPYLGGCILTQKSESDANRKSDRFELGTSYVDLRNQNFWAVPIEKASRSDDLAFNYFAPNHTRSGADMIYQNHSSIAALKNFLTEQNIPYVFKNNPIELKPESYGINLQHYLEPGFENISLSMWTQFEFQNEKYRIHNFQMTTDFLLQVAANGISFLSDYERKDLASQKRGLRRDNDLRILKHQGLACLIIIECCRYVLKKPLTSGQYDMSESEFYEILESNIFDLFKRSILVDKFGEINPYDKKLNSFVSEKVYAFFKKSLVDVLNVVKTKHRCLVLAGQFCELNEYSYFTAETLLAILEPLLIESKGELLTRASSKLLDEVIEFNKHTEITEPVFKNQEIDLELKNQHIRKIKISEEVLNQYYARLSQLALNGWNVSINSIPLEKLGEDDFKSEITVKSSKLDWFELSPKLFFKGIEINLDDIQFSGKRKSQMSGIMFYKGRPFLIDPNSLPRLNALEKFWDRIKNDEINSKTGQKEKEFVRLPKSQILELLALAEAGTQIVSDNKYWIEIYSFYKKLGQKETQIKLPNHLQNLLKEHQLVGTQWIYDLYKLNLGGILADDMGLGKTLQVLTFLNQHKLEKNKTWSLVVVPTSLCFNWESETKRFTPDLDVEIFSGSKKAQLMAEANKSHKIIIATYGLLTEHEEFFTNILWDIVIFDEAQNLKNLASKRTSSARVLKSKFKLALSGTPLENNFMDFFSLTDLVLPGSMGSYKAFQESFGPGKPIDPDDVRHLKLKIKPIVLRRTKESVNLNLPRKLEESLRFDFSEKQIEIYKKLAISHNEQVTQLIEEKGQASTQLAMLTALLRLRQACSDPSGIPQVKFTENPPKIAHIQECVKEHLEEGKSVLIFTQFLATLDKISSIFDKDNIPYFALHGSISGKNRRDLLDKFQNSDQPQVLLMTLKTGGVGLNLTKASVVYHVEPWWNPAVENQATDRSHRLGQTNDVQVYRLLMKDSVEEKIELLKMKKKSYFDALFTDSESLDKLTADSAQLSAEDFKFLLGL